MAAELAQSMQHLRQTVWWTWLFDLFHSQLLLVRNWTDDLTLAEYLEIWILVGVKQLQLSCPSQDPFQEEVQDGEFPDPLGLPEYGFGWAPVLFYDNGSRTQTSTMFCRCDSFLHPTAMVKKDLQSCKTPGEIQWSETERRSLVKMCLFAEFLMAFLRREIFRQVHCVLLPSRDPLYLVRNTRF